MLVLCLSFCVVLLDQLAKHVVRSRFFVGDRMEVIAGFFDLHYIQNTGAAWGIFSGSNHWLVLFSVAMLIVLVVYRRHIMPAGWLSAVAAGLLVGGIAGNLIDRVRLGYVVDYLDFYVGEHHFPAFNVADASICTGVGLYLLFSVLSSSSGPSGARGAPGDGPQVVSHDG